MQMPFSVVCFYCGRLFTSAARAAKGMALHFNFVKQGVGCNFMAILCTLYNYKKACKHKFTDFLSRHLNAIKNDLKIKIFCFQIQIMPAFSSRKL